MEDYKNVKRKLLRDKQIKQAYDKLAPEFELAEMIIKKRLERGFTQADLAKKLGTKQSAIARLESGYYNPSFSFLQKTAKALGAGLHLSIH